MRPLLLLPLHTSARTRPPLLLHASACEQTTARQRAEAAACACEAEATRLRQEADAHAAEATHLRQEADATANANAHGTEATHDVAIANVMILHEAATIANLHAQAIDVQNIRALMPIVHDLVSPNYTKWCGRFLTTLGKYSLADLVLTDAVHAESTDWSSMDCVVREWLYGTISSNLVDIVMAPRTTACLVWLGLEQQFVSNRETRACPHLDAEFRSFVQGDLNIMDYYRKLKSMADALGVYFTRRHE